MNGSTGWAFWAKQAVGFLRGFWGGAMGIPHPKSDFGTHFGPISGAKRAVDKTRYIVLLHICLVMN